MSVKTTNKRHGLQRALESRNWKAVGGILAALPSHLPKNSDPAAITMVLEDARAAADALVQACDFGTAFESSFATRKALLCIPSVLSWATESLTGFSFEQRIIARISAVLGLLGMGSEGRAAVGCAGAVDQLTLVWRSHPTCVDVVRALASLCSGHIDNVSRTMRRRGISIAVQVLSDDTNREDPSLIEQTLIYIGLCSICVPDTAHEERIVVPALLSVLEDDINLRRPRLLRHVLMALGNIMDCWTKEGFGYHLGDENRLVDAILNAWGSLKRSKDIAKSSSWALGSMLAGEGTHSVALRRRLEAVKVLAEPWKTEFKTCAFLYETADQASPEQSAKLNERQEQRTEVVKPVDAVDDHSNVTDSWHEHEHGEKHVVETRSNVVKRRRGTRSLRCKDLREHKAGTQTGPSNSVGRAGFEGECEADMPTVSTCNFSDDDVCSTPDVDPCDRNRQSKKARTRLGNLLTKVNGGNTQIRRSRRCRTRYLNALRVDNNGRTSRSSRYARRIPIEVIEISSESDDERRSPKAVQDICT